MLKKVLIANRGEIALRIIRACKDLDISTVAIHSTADTNSMHVRMADESVCIGPPKAGDSYLSIPNIIAACEISGADAVHPGYGFLSENPKFAQVLSDHEITYVGPSSKHIELMGDKITAKKTMQELGVPCVPGSDGVIRNLKEAKEIALKIGFPLIVKASAGGGGRGMKLVLNSNSLESAFKSAKKEADAANSDPIALLMQQALDGVVGVPWTLMLDRWRGGVFEGTTSNQELNSSWWDLRREYQGITSPAQRPLDAFDPGAKYHIPGNTPYTRYYLARIMQYQFHEALCKKIGFQGPLHECSIYNSKIAGESLRDMLSLGQSVPWQDAFEKITGTRSLSGTSMLSYYMPLKEWLDEQNDGLECGWE